jgi:hypothetical protein
MERFESKWRAAVRMPEGDPCRQLVNSMLYTLVPLGSPPPHWAVWEHPDGQSAVPCFLSESSARKAAAGDSQIVRVPGRDFFKSLGSISLWIDPDEASLLLSGSEVAALLASAPAPLAIGEDWTLADWIDARDLPQPIRLAWTSLLVRFSTARAAYWLQPSAEVPVLRRRLVLLVQPSDETAGMRSMLAEVLRSIYRGPLRIEVQAIGIGELPSAENRLSGFEPFFRADG